MRSTALLASALAVGAMAKPLRHQHKRYFITTEELDVVTVTKYVTAGYEEPAPTAAAAVTHTSVVHHRHSHSAQSAQQPSSVYVPPPVVVSTPVAAPPAPSAAASSVAAPVYSSQAAAPSSQAAAPSSFPGSSGGYSTYSTVTATSGQEYKDSITYFHNVARANHGHDAVTWNDSMASTAQTVANTCKFKHWAPVTGQGQNLFAASGGSMGHIGENLLSGWYTGEYAAMEGSWDLTQLPDKLFGESGHLTQMVWKDTKQIGCASIDCSGQGGVLSESSEGAGDWQNRGLAIMHVCQYYPPGNWANEYAAQVGKGLVDGITNNTDISKLVTQVDAAAKKSYKL